MSKKFIDAPPQLCNLLKVTQLPDFALLESEMQAPPMIYRQNLSRAAAESFLPQTDDRRMISV